MSQPEFDRIQDALTDILRDVFDNDDLVATPALNAADVEGWDSMGNVRLFLAVEKRFGVRFRTGEINEIQNLAELAAAIDRKRPA